jgi:hypothetical protein
MWEINKLTFLNGNCFCDLQLEAFSADNRQKKIRNVCHILQRYVKEIMIER